MVLDLRTFPAILQGGPVWRPLVINDFRPDEVRVFVALGVPALACALAAAWAWWPDVRAWRARRREGKCPACGYDRAGLAAGANCPECGKGGPA
jgi:hypothetical protein